MKLGLCARCRQRSTCRFRQMGTWAVDCEQFEEDVRAAGVDPTTDRRRPVEATPLDEERQRLKDLMTRSVNELELSVRAVNCLEMADIKTIGDLVRKTDAEMLKYRNFGRKSLNEIKEVLNSMGLSLGMDLSMLEDD